MDNSFPLKGFLITIIGVALLVAGSPFLSVFITPYFLILTLLGGIALIALGTMSIVKNTEGS